jgi:hypothetical protein
MGRVDLLNHKISLCTVKFLKTSLRGAQRWQFTLKRPHTLVYRRHPWILRTKVLYSVVFAKPANVLVNLKIRLY